MKKRLIFGFLTLSIVLSLTCAPALAGTASFLNFERTRAYSDTFSDVPADSWYFDYICAAYEAALIDPARSGLFRPADKITVAETIKLAALLHSGYFRGVIRLESSNIYEPWYTPYVDYALKNGIITSEYKNYNAPAVRADFARIIARALPDEAVTPINKIPDGAIPDVAEGFSYGADVYKLYRAGIFTGADSTGIFYPGKTILRAEAVAAVVRMFNPDVRVKLALSAALSPEEIYAQCAQAVFYIEIFDENGDLVKTGSGFFISESGLAVTNSHVVIGAHSAVITTQDGENHNVAGIFDFDRKKDIALLQIDGAGFPYLDTADSDAVLPGASIYTIGSPLGLQNSFSTGIVSGVSRFIEGTEYIQIDAVISSGSSGGALLNSAGLAIGITSAAVDGGQSLNLAVPINLVSELFDESWVPLYSIIIKADSYPDFPVPDFGAYFGLEPYEKFGSTQETSFYYLVSDMSDDPESILDEYSYLLEQSLFSVFGYFTIDGDSFKAYYHSRHDVFVMIGFEDLDGKECISIHIS